MPPLTGIDRSYIKAVDLNLPDELNSHINTHALFHPQTEEYTFFSNYLNKWNLSGIDYILGHEETISKFKKFGITWSVL